MRYHAKLETDETLERPVECFGNDLSLLEDWAQKILIAHPHGRVSISEITENVVRVIGARAVAA